MVRQLGIRLSIKYSIIFIIAISVFLALTLISGYTYISVSSRMQEDLDSSLYHQANQIGQILDSCLLQKNENSELVVDDLINRRDLLLELFNKDDHLLQIADLQNKVLWKSQNLDKYTLPTCIYERRKLKVTNDFKDLNFKDSIDYRIFKGHSDFFQVTIGRPSADNSKLTERILSDIISISIFIFALAILVGIFAGRPVYANISKISRRISSINSKRLSRRIKDSASYIEINDLVGNFNDLMDKVELYIKQNQKFASDAAHELRTPLTILRGELEIALHTQKSPEQYEKVVNSALEEVHRLSEIVETLLELSRAESGKINMSFELENISEMLNEIVEDAEILADEKDIKVKSSIQDNIAIKFDSARVYQAVLNLVENAVKYTPRGGQVSIFLQNSNSGVDIVIEDSGIGMTEEELPHIFDRFYRINSSKLKHIKGNGLGLSIVAWIINAHQGTIEVSSSPDKGSRFNIHLPKDPEK